MRWNNIITLLVVCSMVVSALVILDAESSVGDDSAEKATMSSFSPDVTVFSATGYQYLDGDIARGANYLYALSDEYSENAKVIVKRSVDGSSWSPGVAAVVEQTYPHAGFCVFTVGGRDNIMVASVGYVVKSVDNGSTFTPISPPGYLNYRLDYCCVATNASMNPSLPYDNNVYFAGNHKDKSDGIQLIKTVNDGSSWSSEITVSGSQTCCPVLIRDSSKLYCLFRSDVASEHDIYVKNSSDWGKTWGDGVKVYTKTRASAVPSHAQYIDDQRCLLTIQDIGSPYSNSSGVYGYFWYSNNTFQQVGVETGPTYNNPDTQTYAGIATEDENGINYTSLWCYYINSANTVVKVHHTYDSGIGSRSASQYTEAPKLLEHPTMDCVVGNEYSFNASATMPDNGSGTWTLTTNATWLSKAWSDDTNCLIEGTPDVLGSYWANLMVSDSNSSDFVNWTITVTSPSHSWIVIDGDSGFLADNQTTGISWGSGTEADPYLIKGWSINAGGNGDYCSGIYIRDTTAYFKITECDIYWADFYSIALYGVSNGIITNNRLRDGNNVACIYLSGSTNITISGNSCFGYCDGVCLTGSSNNRIVNNTVRTGGNGVYVVSGSNDNVIYGNVFKENYPFGVSISGSSDNMIWNNSFICCGSEGVPDSRQGYDYGTGNRWNSSQGYGNWWSDWRTPDKVAPFGIVDYPYELISSSGSKDYYPQTPIITNQPANSSVVEVEYSFNASAKLSQIDVTEWELQTNATWLTTAWSNTTKCLVKGTPSEKGKYWAKLIVSTKKGRADGLYWEIDTKSATPPVVIITSPTSDPTMSTGWYMISLKGLATDDTKVTSVTWTNSQGGSGTAYMTPQYGAASVGWQSRGNVILHDGVNIITVTAKDDMGSIATDTLTISYNLGPTVAITNPTSNPTMLTNWHMIYLMGTASDDSKVVSVTWSNSLGGSGIAYMSPQFGGPSVTWQSRGNVLLYHGDNVITVTATDNTGKTATDVLTVTYTGY